MVVQLEGKKAVPLVGQKAGQMALSSAVPRVDLLAGSMADPWAIHLAVQMAPN